MYALTEGHALFTVELLHSLKDQGRLVRDAEGRWMAGSTLDWRTLPPRVEAVIEERLDRLPPTWRAILDVASVEGATFTAEVVAGVLGIPPHEMVHTLSNALGRDQRLIQSAGLQQTTKGKRLSRYRFRHALFQRYLYRTLDEAERAHLHEAAGAQLERLHDIQAETSMHQDDLAPLLAWHFERAEIWDKAAAYYLAAGHRAYRLSAHEEAIAHYRRGLASLKRLPPTETSLPPDPADRMWRARCRLALLLGLGRPLATLHGWANPEQVHACEQAYELAGHIENVFGNAPPPVGKENPDHRNLFHSGNSALGADFLQTFYTQVDMAHGQGEYQQALALSRRLYQLAEQSGDPQALGLAHWTLGSSHFFRGTCRPARKHLEAALTLYRQTPSRFPAFAGPDMGVSCLSWLSLALCTLGYPEQAQTRAREALELAQHLDLPLSRGMALALAGCNVNLYCRQTSSVQAYAAELLAFTHAKRAPLFQEWVEIALGWYQVQNGAFESGIARMQRGVRAWQRMGTVPGQFLHLTLLTEAYHKAGRNRLGLACSDEALQLLQRTGQSNHEPEIYRIYGELLQSQHENTGEIYFQRAIDLARRREARLWELRARLSLCRLRQAQGPRDGFEAARQALATLYNRFDEGLDMPDLREVREMLHA